jgi:hypothetical protein
MAPFTALYYYFFLLHTQQKTDLASFKDQNQLPLAAF